MNEKIRKIDSTILDMIFTEKLIISLLKELAIDASKYDSWTAHYIYMHLDGYYNLLYQGSVAIKRLCAEYIKSEMEKQ